MFDDPLRLDLRRLRQDYLVVKVLRGRCVVTRGHQRTVLRQAGLTMVAPDQPLVLWAEAGTVLRMIKIGRDALHQKCVRTTGVLPPSPLWFQPADELTSRAWRAWSERLEFLLSSLDNAKENEPSGYWWAIEDVFLSWLIRYPGHDYEDRILHRRLAYALDVPTSALEGAEFVAALIRIDPLAKLSLARCMELAVLSSRRDLKRAFRLLWGTSMCKFRRAVRLNGAHLDLLDAVPSRGMARKIARRWGFRYWVLFSWLYHNRFGEWPDDTLHRRPRQ